MFQKRAMMVASRLRYYARSCMFHIGRSIILVLRVFTSLCRQLFPSGVNIALTYEYWLFVVIDQNLVAILSYSSPLYSSFRESGNGTDFARKDEGTVGVPTCFKGPEQNRISDPDRPNLKTPPVGLFLGY
jgi:hypothetical protein